MRTRIEIDDVHREQLLKLAAERGERGCARIVQEAVAQYLEHKERPPVVVELETRPLRPESRGERLRLVVEWVVEEAVGLLAVARTFRGRLRRSTAPAN
jgi:hypothetical protein